MADLAANANTGATEPSDADATLTATGARLRAFIERVERLEEEKKALAEDIKEIYSEAKGHGFDVKIIRKIVALRKKDPDDRAEEEALMDTYLSALGMI